MARAALEWSTQELARRAEVGLNSVNRFEGCHDARLSTVAKIERAFTEAGIEFLGDNGVRAAAVGFNA